MSRRSGNTSTFSISVDRETQHILKREAVRSYDGNVSALIAAIAKEAKLQSALDWLLEGTKISDAERATFLAEIDGTRKPRKHARSA